MTTITLGSAEIHRVEETTCRMPMAALTEDADLLDRHRDWLRPRFLAADEHWELVYQSWVAVVDERVIVVDPCVGNGRPFPDFPPFDNLDTPYLERFAAAGFRPGDVDVVFCTHLHGDHCGWNTRLANGRYVPTFPKARYLMARREVAHWDTRRPGHADNPFNRGVFERSVLPVLEAGLVDLVDGDHQVSPSFAIEPAPGHTPGHAVAWMKGGDRLACFSGDAFHHPLELVSPELDLGASEDFPATLATRRRLQQRFLRQDVLIVPAHFPAPHVGRLARDGERLVFAPGAA